MPCAASQATSAEPSSPPSCLGETSTEYASSPATFDGVASEMAQWTAAWARAFVTSSSVGGECCALFFRDDRSATYAVFDDAS